VVSGAGGGAEGIEGGVWGRADALSLGGSEAARLRAGSESLGNSPGSLSLIADASFWIGLESVGDAGCCGGGAGAFSFPLAVLLGGFEGPPAAFVVAAIVLRFFVGGAVVAGIGGTSPVDRVVGESVKGRARVDLARVVCP